MSIEIRLVYMIGISMFAVALYYAYSTKPVTIYNQGKTPSATELTDELTDVTIYNRVTAKLMFVYGCVFITEGPFLSSHPMTCMFIGIFTIIPGLTDLTCFCIKSLSLKNKIKIKVHMISINSI